MKKTILIFTIAVIGILRAGEPTYSKALDICLKKIHSSADTQTCYDQETARWDTLLNRNYHALMKEITDRLDPKAAQAKQQELRKVQRLWLKFRERNCDLRLLYGGSMEYGFVRACFMRMTAERAIELNELTGY